MDITQQSNTDVLIVGAGPTGLTLAITLAQAGIKHIIVDKLATGQNTSRAAVIHAHTLEVLEHLGVSQQLMNQGMPLATFSVRDRDRVLTRLRFDKLPTAYACLLMLPQDQTERILAETLHAHSSSIQWGCTVESVAATSSDARATIIHNDRKTTITARYIVGADGMHSIVRESAGIGFRGKRFEESFVLADIDMTWPHGRDEVMLFFAPAGMVVVAPLPSGRFRIVATLDHAPEYPGMADVQNLLDTRGPARGRAQVTHVHWSSRFHLHHRVADDYRRGPLLLVGDAAHVHSPAGGQGMNTGLVDAYVLGRMLAEVVSGRRDDAFLDRYQSLRRPAAQMVLKMSGRLTRLATMHNPLQRTMRNAIFRTINALPPARRKLEMNFSGLSRRDAAVIPKD